MNMLKRTDEVSEGERAFQIYVGSKMVDGRMWSTPELSTDDSLQHGVAESVLGADEFYWIMQFVTANVWYATLASMRCTCTRWMSALDRTFPGKLKVLYTNDEVEAFRILCGRLKRLTPGSDESWLLKHMVNHKFSYVESVASWEVALLRGFRRGLSFEDGNFMAPLYRLSFRKIVVPLAAMSLAAWRQARGGDPRANFVRTKEGRAGRQLTTRRLNAYQCTSLQLVCSVLQLHAECADPDEGPQTARRIRITTL